MFRKQTVSIFVLSLGLLAAADARAGAVTAIYDMDGMMGQVHPFEAEHRLRTAPPPPPAPEPEPMPQAAELPEPEPEEEGLGGILSEVRVGALAHDFGPFSHQKEDGVDANLEFLFVSPDFMELIWSPRPHIGGHYNTSGDTNQVYAGLTWEWDFWESDVGNAFAGFSWGGAYHDGSLDDDKEGKKQLGCHVLFRESVTAGYRFAGHHGIMVHFDHISNAKLCSTNEGLESLGVRYGYKF